MNKKKIADKDIKAAIESARRFARKHGAIGINDEDDLVQDLMVRWMKNSIAHVPPRAWMTKTMRCVVYDQLRKKQISPMLADDNLDTATCDLRLPAVPRQARSHIWRSSRWPHGPSILIAG